MLRLGNGVRIGRKSSLRRVSARRLGLIGSILLSVHLAATPSEAWARYPSKTGRICDENMDKASSEYSLDKQFNFAFNCLEGIRKETGRTHDAYMLWLSEIHEKQGKHARALEYAWWAIGATRENNSLDRRSKNDFLSIAFLTVLLRMTGLASQDSSHIKPLSDDSAKTLHDWSLAVMKLSGCSGARELAFIGPSKSFQQHSSIDFDLADTTLTLRDKDGHCGISSASYLLSEIARRDNPDLLGACEKVRAVTKRLALPKNQGFRETLGPLYLQMVAYLNDGRCSGKYA